MRIAPFLAASLLAAPAAAQPAQPPKLIVAISVDQLSSDLFEAYRFVNGYQAHAATETCPGHSTLLTGRWPAATGIVANNWVDQRIGRDDKTIYCAEDPRVPGSTSRSYTVSPEHLKASTLGDRLKAINPVSRNVAVAGKDRAAVMMSGHKADQRWYWDGKAWSTDLKAAPVPRSVAAFRTAFAAQLAAPQPGLTPPALCQAKATPFRSWTGPIWRSPSPSPRSWAWGAGRRRTSSRSASARPTMSGTASAGRGRRCASRCLPSTGSWATSWPGWTRPAATMPWS